MNIGPSVIRPKQTYLPGVQNIPSQNNVETNSRVSFGNPGISSKLHEVLHGNDREVGTKLRHDFSVKGEQNKLNNIELYEHVVYSSESSVPSDMSQRHNDFNPALPLQHSFKNNILCDKDCSVETANHIKRPYKRTSKKQKSKQFFPEVTKGISVNNVASRLPVSDKRDASYNLENSSRFGEHFPQDVISKNLSQNTYRYNGHFLNFDRNVDSYTHHKLSKDIYPRMLSNLDPGSQNSLFVDQKNHSGHGNRSTAQRRHSHHFEHVEGRISRSFVETISSSIVSGDVPWPVKKEAVVEGDLVLGGLMMVHEREDSITCGPIMPQGGIQALETMLYTLDVLNRGPDKIPNVTIGAHILDDCDKDTYGLEMAVDFIKGRRRLIEMFHFNNVISFLGLYLKIRFCHAFFNSKGKVRKCICAIRILVSLSVSPYNMIISELEYEYVYELGGSTGPGRHLNPRPPEYE
jgi:hypothetical protein